MARMRNRDFGSSIRLSGSSSSITLASRLVISGAFTYMGWFKHTPSSVASPTGYIFGDSTTDIKIGFNASQTLSARLISAAALLATNSGVRTPINEWFFLALRRNPDNSFEISVNGSTWATFNGSLNTTGNTAINLIGATNSGQQFKGLMDSIHLYSGVACTQAEINAAYYKGEYPASPTVSYFFNDAASPATDGSGNNNNGTLANATYDSNDVVMKLRASSSLGRVVARAMNASYRFIGTTGGVSLGVQTYLDGKPFTIGAWVKMTPGVPPRIFSYGFNFAANLGVLLRTAGTAGITNRLQAFFGNSTATGTVSLNPGWNHVVMTYDGSSAVRFYVNGVLDPATPTATPRNANPATATWIGSEVGSAGVAALYRSVFIGDRVLTASEIASIYSRGAYPSGLKGLYMLDEGAGTTAIDSSGSGINGTLSGSGVYDRDVPVAPRLNPAILPVRNSDFAYIPPFVAATNVTARWIDGTAGGSLTNDVFGWGLRNATGTFAASFDDGGIKLSLLATNSVMEVWPTRVLGMADINAYGTPVLPNTPYVLTFRMRTNYVSGDSSDGASLTVVERDANNGNSISTGSTKVKTTTGWTTYSIPFTTAATTRFVALSPRIFGNTGAATLIMDAWFDDFELRPVTPAQRVMAP